MREVADEMKNLDGISFRLVTAGGDDGWTVPASERLYEESLRIDAEPGKKRLLRIGAFHISFAAKSVFLALVETESSIPFFIEMPQSSENKLISIVTRQFILWRSAKVADIDPFGIRGVQRMTDSDPLQPIVQFIIQTLKLPHSTYIAV